MKPELKNMLVFNQYRIDEETPLQTLARMKKLGLENWVLCLGGSEKSPNTVINLIEIYDFPAVSYWGGLWRIENIFKTGTNEAKILMAEQLELLSQITLILSEGHCAYNYPITWNRLNRGPANVTYQNSVTLAQEYILKNRDTKIR